LFYFYIVPVQQGPDGPLGLREMLVRLIEYSIIIQCMADQNDYHSYSKLLQVSVGTQDRL